MNQTKPLFKRMRKSTLFVAALLMPFCSFGATVWNLNGNEFKVDTLQHVKIGPATTETSLALSGSKNLRVFYTTTDLSNQSVDVRVVKANDKLASCATVSSMAEKATSDKGKLYFSGVNADFFAGSAPCGHAMVDGEIYRTLGNSSWPSFGFTSSRKPIIGVMNQVLSKIKVGATEYSLTGINCGRGENGLVLYTHLQGDNTGTNAYGTEIVLESVDGNQAIAGRTSKMRVVSAAAGGQGSTAIPANGFVLSAHGTSQAIISDLTVGTEIELTVWAQYDGKDVADITQMAGGQPVILKNGEILNTEGALDHLVANNPRTAVGYNDKGQLVMLVVDGRSSISAGCISKELAGIMKYVGCTEAMNFDGGGSSTIYAGPKLGVLNNTSDGHERAVTNGLYLVATGDYADNQVAEIMFKDADENRVVCLPQYGIYTPSFFSFNKAEVLLSTNQEGVKLALEGDNAKFGEIINDGTTLYVTAPSGSFALTAIYNGVKKNVPVSIQAGEVSFKYDRIIIDSKREYAVEVSSTILENSMPLDNRALAWSTADEQIATVENGTGIVRGVGNGETQITGKVGDFSGVLNVKVEIPEKEVMPIVKDIVAGEWALKQTGGKGIAISSLENGFALDYTGNGASRGAYISADRTCQIWSLPTKLQVRINPGDAIVKKVSANISNALGEKVTSWVISDTELPKKQESVLSLDLAENFDVDDIGIYPITVNSLRLDMGKSDKDKNYQIAVPGFEAVYEPQGAVESVATDNDLRIYPNPVAAGAAFVVETAEAAVVEVYSLNGMLVEKTVAEGSTQVSTANFERGVYVVKVSYANGVRTAKLVVK